MRSLQITCGTCNRQDETVGATFRDASTSINAEQNESWRNSLFPFFSSANFPNFAKRSTCALRMVLNVPSRPRDRKSSTIIAVRLYRNLSVLVRLSTRVHANVSVGLSQTRTLFVSLPGFPQLLSQNARRLYDRKYVEARVAGAISEFASIPRRWIGFRFRVSRSIRVESRYRAPRTNATS